MERRVARLSRNVILGSESCSEL